LREKDVVLYWDILKEINDEKEYLKENPEEHPELNTDEKIMDYIYNSDILDFRFEELTSNLTEFMKKHNQPNYYKNMWVVSVNNFGWRNLSGAKIICAESGEDLLRQLLPKTECTFYIYKNNRNSFKIQNFHHDSPTGNEWYYVKAMTIPEVNKGEDLVYEMMEN